MKGDADLSGMKILVVEDNFLVADTLCEALRDYGCEIVGPAPNVERGADLMAQSGVEDGRLTGALLDINLNGSTSISTAKRRFRSPASCWSAAFPSSFSPATAIRGRCPSSSGRRIASRSHTISMIWPD
jgi:hypothetical protein